MKKVILAIIIITLQSCIEKEGYYNDGQNKIISLICDTIWCRDKINNENGTTYQDAYNFNEDGTYEHIIITTDSEGTEHINKTTRQWSFYVPALYLKYIAQGRNDPFQPLFSIGKA